MKYIKKFESINQVDFLTYEEIKDFFQEFIDDNDFNNIKNNSLESDGFYDIEFSKVFSMDMCGYSHEEGCTGYSSPSLILNKISFIKELDDIKKRLDSVGYVFNFDIAMSADSFGFSIRILCMGCHKDNIDIEREREKKVDPDDLFNDFE